MVDRPAQVPAAVRGTAWGDPNGETYRPYVCIAGPGVSSKPCGCCEPPGWGEAKRRSPWDGAVGGTDVSPASRPHAKVRPRAVADLATGRRRQQQDDGLRRSDVCKGMPKHRHRGQNKGRPASLADRPFLAQPRRFFDFLRHSA